MDSLIADRIKDLRIEHGFTQEELAEKLYCKRQKIADWERHKSSPSIDDIISLSKIFKVSADYILGLTGTKTFDMDVRFISDYTGLSEHSVKTLNARYKIAAKVYRNNIQEKACECFICNDLYLFSDYVARYIYLLKAKKEELIAAISELKKTGKLGIEKTLSIGKRTDELNLILFKIQEASKAFTKQLDKELTNEVEQLEKKFDALLFDDLLSED